MTSANAIFVLNQILRNVNTNLQRAMVELTSLFGNALDDIVDILEEIFAERTKFGRLKGRELFVASQGLGTE